MSARTDCIMMRSYAMSEYRKKRIMQTEILSPSSENIEKAARLLRSGEVVAIPTETVYGLAANAYDVNAVGKIFKAKGRPQDNPLIVHIAQTEALYDIACAVPEGALRLAERFWPGPLTMILPKKNIIPDCVSASLPSVAVRMPSHPVANGIIRCAGVPLAAPSANISGFPSPTCLEHVYDDMNGRIPAIVDGGQCEFGVESTVIALTGKTPRLLRPGGIIPEMLESVLGKIDIDDAVLNPLASGRAAASPGMKYRHYSPKCRVIIVRGDLNRYLKYIESVNNDEKTFCLCFEGEQELMPLPAVTYGTADNPLSQTRRLFDALRELDEAGAQLAYARAPSESGLGLAVCNRLYRAAAFTFVG